MWMSHVTCINESCHTSLWVMSHVSMSHVKHMSESCHTCVCEWVMWNMWMSHVAHVNESCHTCEWVMSNMWISHAAHVNESCHTCEWVMGAEVSCCTMAWRRMCDMDGSVTLVNKSCHTHEWVMSHTWMSHCREGILLRDGLEAYMRFTYDWIMSHAWIIHMCDMVYAYMWCALGMCVIWRACVGDVNQSFVWGVYAGCICVYVVHICLMYVTHVNDSWSQIDKSCHTRERVMLRLWISPITDTNESCLTCTRGMSHM